MDTNEIADALATRGIAIRRDFLAAEDLRALALECREAWLAGHFRSAGVGRAAGREVRREVRGDYIHWLPNLEVGTAALRVLERMGNLRAAINRRTYLGLFDLECHFALYPPGAVYRRHVDTFRDVSRRVVSWILYLTDDWTEADGGQLRIYRPARRGGDAARDDLDGVHFAGDHLDVVPFGGTLATFLSADYEHEVLAARRERASLTGWFKTRE